MTYLLDTNVCIHYLNRTAPVVLERMESLSPADLVLCSVVKAELLYGAYKSKHLERSLRRLEKFFAPYESLPFDDDAADAYGSLRAHLEQAGTPIGPNDLMIGATALVHGVKLVTNNVREFSRVPDLSVEDWERA